MSTPSLRLFTFGPAFGLPTAGPFGLKLEGCLRMLGVPFERVFESDNRKGPKRKSPWIEDGDVKMGDSELILQYVATKYGKELDGELSAGDRARSHVLRGMLEEKYHQVFEYELCVLDEGFVELREMFEGKMPGPMIAIVAPLVRHGFKKHLFERGIARHGAADVAAMGKADIDALSAWLGDDDWFIADHPTKVDASAFGLLAVSIRSPMQTPVCAYARTKANLVAFVDRFQAKVWGEQAAQEAA
jgi:glutathione S-transferase